MDPGAFPQLLTSVTDSGCSGFHSGGRGLFCCKPVAVCLGGFGQALSSTVSGLQEWLPQLLTALCGGWCG